MVLAVKDLPADAGDAGSIPAFRRSPGEENGNPLQYSCLENSMHRGAWQATVHGVATPTVQDHSLFSTPSLAFIVCRLFDDGHSDPCEMIPHFGFDFRFSGVE